MKKIINCEKAPAALGPYSHGCEYGGFIFTSGQIGLDPATGKLQEGIEAQTRQVLTNLQNVLATAGASLDNVLKTTIFITDMANFADVNKVYSEFFGSDCPGRSCVAVKQLPAGAIVEIECIAFKG